MAKQSGEIETWQRITRELSEKSRLLVARSDTHSTVIQFRRTEPITRTLDFSRLCVSEKVFRRVNMHVISVEDSRFVLPCWEYSFQKPLFLLNISRFYIIETRIQRNNGYSAHHLTRKYYKSQLPPTRISHEFIVHPRLSVKCCDDVYVSFFFTIAVVLILDWFLHGASAHYKTCISL